MHAARAKLAMSGLFLKDAENAKKIMFFRFILFVTPFVQPVSQELL